MEKRIISYKVATPTAGLPTGNPLDPLEGQIGDLITVAIPDEKTIDAECVYLGKDGAIIAFTVENNGTFNYRTLALATLLTQRFDVVGNYKDQLVDAGFNNIATEITENEQPYEHEDEVPPGNIYADAAFELTKDLRKTIAGSDDTSLRIQYSVNYDMSLMKSYVGNNKVRKVKNGLFYNEKESAMTSIYENKDMSSGAARPNLGTYMQPDGSFICFANSPSLSETGEYSSLGLNALVTASRESLDFVTADQQEAFAKAYQAPKEG